MFKQAIVRPPSATFADGLTSVDLGVADVVKARQQHELYCAALERCGVELIRLEPADEFPDSTFIEDVAVLTGRCAVLTRPGAASRRGEVALIEPLLTQLFPVVHRIEAPGTIDAGDVCQAGDRFFIGISERSNEHGAHQLAALLGAHGHASTLLDIRPIPGILHLKTGMSWIGDNRVVLIDTMVDLDAFRDYQIVPVHPRENYAANCIRVNDHVIIAAGFPRIAAALAELGHALLPVDTSEFRKMDGALTCLSLRF